MAVIPWRWHMVGPRSLFRLLRFSVPLLWHGLSHILCVMEFLPHSSSFRCLPLLFSHISPSSINLSVTQGNFYLMVLMLNLMKLERLTFVSYLILQSRNMTYLFYLFIHFPVKCIWVICTLICVDPATFCWIYPSRGVELLSWLTPVFVY